jgi:DnaK suppressor protein
MTTTQLEEFRTILTDLLRETVSGTLAAVHDVTEPDPAQGEPGDSADEAVRVNARADIERMGEREAGLAKKIEAALRRITAGDNGVCVDCGNEIELERLRAIPWTDRCVDDAERAEFAGTDPSPSL